MQAVELENHLDAKEEATRLQIADRVGERLTLDNLPDAERRAAESLARELVCDAIEQVRSQLSHAVKHARFLPKDIAFKIAHDVESVACPFLEVTEVLSENDLQQICRKLSSTALLAVARRSSMTEGLALTLADVGDSVVAEALIENPATPMTVPVCDTLVDRFFSDGRILDKLAQRDDLAVEIAVKLIAEVSAAARHKLIETYKLPDFTEPIGVDAEDATLLQLIQRVPRSSYPALVDNLKTRGKLSYSLLLAAIRKKRLAFLQAALANLADIQSGIVGTVIFRSEASEVFRLLRKARIPESMDEDFWQALTAARDSNDEQADADAG